MMKKTLLLLALAIGIGLIYSCGDGERFARTYYVALDGDDANAGTKSSPFATLERARDEIRTLRSGEGLPDGGIRVVIADGIYRRTSTFMLTAEDSGTESCPIVYGGESKRGVNFLGGVLLTAWEPATTDGAGARLRADVRDKVMQVDLTKAGITDLGTVSATYEETTRADLFCNGEYMSLARWPDIGEWALIADVPMYGPEKVFYDGITHYGRFVYSEDRPSRWKDQSDIWVNGFFVYDWANQTQRVARLDTLKKEVHPEKPYHAYGYRSGQRFFFLNLPEELDTPGEFYVDRAGGILYFYPPADIAASRVIFPDLRVPMIALEETDYVTIERITVEASRTVGITVRGGKGNRIAGCDFLNLGDWGVDIQGGSENSVVSCDLYQLARGGIHITGGDRQTITPCNHSIENCDIHHNGRIFKSSNQGVLMEGVGIRFVNNYLHHTAHTGLFYFGNEHTFEYNEFSHIGMETGDVGCINTGYDWTFMGHEVSYNYFHDIHSPGHLGCFTVYPDIPVGGIHLHHNIFYNTDWAFHTNSGRGMLIENNLILESRGISYKIWPFKKFFFVGGHWRAVERLAEVNYDQPPYSTRYPVLARLAEDFRTQTDSTVQVMERQLSKDNLVRNNIATGGVFLRFIGPVDLKQVRTENNLICTDAAYAHSPNNIWDDFTSYTADPPEIIEELKAAGNTLLLGEDPGIVDPAGGDFSFVEGSPASKMPFDPIPVEKMGLKKDKYRTVLP